MPILETQRLLLRQFSVDDAELFYNLNSDPDVVRYTGNNAFNSIEEAKQFLENYFYYGEHALGRWAVIRKTDTEFLGWCGLKYSEDLDETDIGFRFFKKHWNLGYATESAKACIELGFTRFKLNEIVGRAMKENTSSIRVLEKLGMSYEREFDFDGQPGVIYKIKTNL